MATVIEWRSKTEGDDAVLAVERESYSVLKAWQADPALLTDFLNDMKGLDIRGRNGEQVSPKDPEAWGDLVISRSDEGDVLYIDPQLYWEGIAYWFRSRGEDPHPYQGRR